MNKKNIIIFVFVVGFGVMLAGCGVKTKGAHEADRTPLVISEDAKAQSEKEYSFTFKYEEGK